ncbi:alkene reductase [Streptacidiphilus sp. P02-A3a]|uniref:alkene reductase n=1 Tax=Streptacidiphilus sp. P02-A3a TaxID=2704468 RepID=UPI0015FB1286|nr:alkene reductase [Streptacidiphilus sp. P02-A3a]QMU70234.1 alkene reductase [Streptacidiphilus sp. P02-A3a]QMU70310.1 alkene reductase [Streptacidiphilus sp. P02-A3a]
MSVPPLFTPTRMGALELPNRIAMAPLTRMRADNPGRVPTGLHAEYYAQRAGAGLIVGEATAISPEAVGWADTPGLWSPQQVHGWRGVTDAVHAAGSRMIAQLWHTGSLSHPDFFDGAPPMSASAVNPEQLSSTPTGRKPTVTPRAMTRAEIRRTVADYATAARNAVAAGFDGVQILANFTYLPAQFLNRATNRRTDRYGGSIANRARLVLEIIESVAGAIGPERTGIKLGPMHESGPFTADDETLPTAEYVVSRLDDYRLSHLLLMGATHELAGTPLADLAGDGMFRHFRPLYGGTLIASVDMDAERGNRLVRAGLADVIAFGRPFIANPDLPARLATGAAPADTDWSTVYAAGPAGYTDYPALEPVAA